MSDTLHLVDPNRHQRDITLRVEVTGEGPTLLFVHGWPVSGATFRCLLPHLVDHVTCHVIDMPGVGSSRFTATTPLSIDMHIESVRAAIDQAAHGLDVRAGHPVSLGKVARQTAAQGAHARPQRRLPRVQIGGHA